MFRKIFQVGGHCLYQSLRHPRTRITQVNNPEPIKVSVIPWWGGTLVLLFGTLSWCVASMWNIKGLDEASRAMVYVSLTHLFEMSYWTARQINSPPKGRKG